MARADSGWDTEQRIARGQRLAALRDQTGLTVLEFAAELNRVAAQLGVPQRWTGPKVSRMTTGLQAPTVDDILVLAAYDPEQRPAFWWAFGRDEATVKRAGKHPPPKPADASLYRSVPPRHEPKRKRSG